MDRVRLALLAVLVMTTSTIYAAPPGDAPHQIPGWLLPQRALDALWDALGWLLILP